MFRCPGTRAPLTPGPPGGGRMGDESGAQPLPRRVPGASGSPRPTAPIERTPISEDLRQRVLSAIAVELERDKAEHWRRAPEQGGSSPSGAATDPATANEPGAGPVPDPAPGAGPSPAAAS